DAQPRPDGSLRRTGELARRFRIHDAQRGLEHPHLHLPPLRDRPGPSHDDAGAVDLRADRARRGVYDHGAGGEGISRQGNINIKPVSNRASQWEAIMSISRRDVLAGAGALAATAASGSAMAQSFAFKPNQRYPEPSLEILDPGFLKYRIYSSTVEQIASGMRWSEGPAYFPEGGYLLWSDIPNNRIMKYNERDNSVTVFRSPSNFANGNTRDRQGRLVTCEHSVTRRITRTEKNGKITVLADKFEGKRLNAPNDIVVKSDDTIWFTDPPFGILGDWEGFKATPEQ